MYDVYMYEKFITRQFQQCKDDQNRTTDSFWRRPEIIVCCQTKEKQKSF